MKYNCSSSFNAWRSKRYSKIYSVWHKKNRNKIKTIISNSSQGTGRNKNTIKDSSNLMNWFFSFLSVDKRRIRKAEHFKLEFALENWFYNNETVTYLFHKKILLQKLEFSWKWDRKGWLNKSSWDTWIVGRRSVVRNYPMMLPSKYYFRKKISISCTNAIKQRARMQCF